MSIDPVTTIRPATDSLPAPGNIRDQQLSPAATPANCAQPNSACKPKEEIRDLRNDSQSSELPRDEVQVQQGSETNGRIVIKYLDHSGKLILQVPTSQVLGLARAVDRALEEQTQTRVPESGARAKSEGG